MGARCDTPRLSDLRAALLAAALPLLAIAGVARGQCEVDVLRPPRCSDHHLTGGVGISGDFTIAGAPSEGEGAGAVYFHSFDGTAWSQDARFTNSQVEEAERLGRAVAIRGEVAIAGVYYDEDCGYTGHVRIYRHDGSRWTWEASRRVCYCDDEWCESDLFGYAVAIHGDVAVVGAPGDSGGGAAYVFRFDGENWDREAKLLASDRTSGDRFGETVAIDGDVIVVGAPEEGITAKGSAYVFRRDGREWLEEARLRASDRTSHDRFAAALAVDGRWIVVGAPGDEESGRPGKVFAYRFNDSTWIEKDRFVDDGGSTPDDRFGAAVAISHDLLVVGAMGNDDHGEDAGAAYVFRKEDGAWPLMSVLRASAPGAGDRFGASVAIDGEVALVAAGAHSGSVHVYRLEQSTWTEEAKLLACGDVARNDFGAAAAMRGDLAVVGAPEYGEHAGAADVYRRRDGTWAIDATLFPPPPAPERFGWAVATDGARLVVASWGDAFLYEHDGAAWQETARLDAGAEVGERSVAIEGEVILVGHPNDDRAGYYAGAVFVYRRAGEAWALEAVLTAEDTAPFDRFGWAVSVSGDRVLVGAHLSDGSGRRYDAGAAYLFRYDGTRWLEEKKLLASDGAEDHRFGYAVSLDGDRATVGAPQIWAPGPAHGAAYVYDRRGPAWVETKLTAADGAPDDWFGNAVAQRGNLLVVGARYDDDRGADSGSAYVFRHDGLAWRETAKLLASDGTAGDLFGESVAVDAGEAIVGAEAAAGTGAAYVFAGVTAADCNHNGIADACDLLDPTRRDEDGNGVPDECDGRCANAFSVYVPGASTYLSFDDSPWRDVAEGLDDFWIEDFEDGRLDTPGASASAGAALAPSAMTDSVDGDGGGVIDGWGRDGWSWFVQDPAGASVTFSFDGEALGGLPTLAGVVWTDGDPDALVTFTALGADGAPIVTFDAQLGDGVHDGSTAADRFLGARWGEGIAAITVSASEGSMEVDHLQYGLAPLCRADLDGNGRIDTADLLAVLAAWGPCDGACCEDLDASGFVAVGDLLPVLAGWGPCR